MNLTKGKSGPVFKYKKSRHLSINFACFNSLHQDQIEIKTTINNTPKLFLPRIIKLITLFTPRKSCIIPCFIYFLNDRPTDLLLFSFYPIYYQYHNIYITKRPFSYSSIRKYIKWEKGKPINIITTDYYELLIKILE